MFLSVNSAFNYVLLFQCCIYVCSVSIKIFTCLLIYLLYIKLTRLSVYISLPHIMAARSAGIDRNEEITPLSPYALLKEKFNIKIRHGISEYALIGRYLVVTLSNCVPSYPLVHF